MDRCLAMLGLTYVKGFGPVWIKRLLEYFDNDPIQVWNADDEKLEDALQGRSSLIQAMHQISWQDVEKEFTLIQKQNLRLILSGDQNYPELLINIYDPPPILYCQGTWTPKDNLAIGIVGTRHPSPYGRNQAYRLAKALAQRGITIVSGLARGIDIAAHRGALAGKGRTIAVLGCGLGYIYPEEHKKEASSIQQNGALFSEYPVMTPPNPGYFPQRNRIISGLSLGVIVVEAGERSGALITAHLALEQGHEVFAVPGEIDREETVGTHRLIQQGAKLVTCVDDVIEEILALQTLLDTSQVVKQWQSELDNSLSSAEADSEHIEQCKLFSPQSAKSQESAPDNVANTSSAKSQDSAPDNVANTSSAKSKDSAPDNVANTSSAKSQDSAPDNRPKAGNNHHPSTQQIGDPCKKKNRPLSSEQQKIWDVLSGYPQHIDVITAQLEMSPSQVSSILLIMELQGIISLWPGHRYARAQPSNDN